MTPNEQQPTPEINWLDYAVRSSKVINAHLAQLKDKADRDLGIVGATLLDDHLANHLRSRMPGLTESEDDQLFGEYGSLGNFAPKINVARGLGLISGELAAELKLISRIRNRFAHYLQDEFFSAQTVRKFCEKLKLVDIAGLQSCGVTMENLKEFETVDPVRIDGVTVGMSIMDANNRILFWVPELSDDPSVPRERFLNSVYVTAFAITSLMARTSTVSPQST